MTNHCVSIDNIDETSLKTVESTEAKVISMEYDDSFTAEFYSFK